MDKILKGNLEEKSVKKASKLECYSFYSAEWILYITANH